MSRSIVAVQAVASMMKMFEGMLEMVLREALAWKMTRMREIFVEVCQVCMSC